MAGTIGRRELLAALGGAAAAWPISARAQQPTMPVVGWLGSETREDDDFTVVAFREGLKEGGYSEGQNVTTGCSGNVEHDVHSCAGAPRRRARWRPGCHDAGASRGSHGNRRSTSPAPCRADHQLPREQPAAGTVPVRFPAPNYRVTTDGKKVISQYKNEVSDGTARKAIGTEAWGADRAYTRYADYNKHPTYMQAGSKHAEPMAPKNFDMNNEDTDGIRNYSQDNRGRGGNYRGLYHNDVREGSWIRGDDPTGAASAGQRNPNFIAGYRSPPGKPGFEGARSVESQSGHPLRGEIKNNRPKYQGRKDAGYGEK